MEFNLGELLLIYDGLRKLPRDLILNTGTMQSGVKHESVELKQLKEKVKKYGEELENSMIGKY